MPADFVYLASASPRRRELLGQIGVRFEVRIAAIDERLRPGEAPDAYVLRVAEAKAENVWRALTESDPPAVLAADTAVVLGERVLGKPSGETEALEMLGWLSGRTHRVFTAVVLQDRSGVASALNVSEVRFRATTDAERRAYCATGEPLDKAGAYGIQGLGAVFVDHLNGSYSGVVGLPLRETADLLKPIGLPGWTGDRPRPRPAG